MIGFVSFRYAFSRSSGQRGRAIRAMITIALSLVAVTVVMSVMEFLQEGRFNDIRDVRSFSVIVEGRHKEEIQQLFPDSTVFEYGEGEALHESGAYMVRYIDSDYDGGLNYFYGDASSLLSLRDRGFSASPYEAGKDRTYSYDYLPLEISTLGEGDFRTPSLIVEREDGTLSSSFIYSGHRIYKGSERIKGLPSVEIADAECLEITLSDSLSSSLLILTYIAKDSTLLRGMQIKGGKEKITLRKALYSMDEISSRRDVIWFDGRHCSERNIKRERVDTATLTLSSRRGATSHQMNNSFILASPETTENSGEAFIISLLWSGSFTFFAEKDQYDTARFALGPGSEYFSYSLTEEETLTLPFLILTYSENGLGDLSVKHSRFVRKHIARKRRGGLKDPVLLNNWEATYFDFNGDKLMAIAKEAKSLGCDLFVLDDGWFGHRNDDLSSLGDW